jgi:hypothetical protein
MLTNDISRLAGFFVSGSKWAVDYDRVFSSFLSEYDLEKRGLPDVFRTLADRVSKVLVMSKSEWCDEYSPRPMKVEYETPSGRVDYVLRPWIDSSFEKAKVMTHSYLECVELLGGPRASWYEIQKNIIFYFCLALNDELEEFLKYQTASLCAIALNNPSEEQPSVVQRGKWRVGEFIPYCKRVMFWIRKLCIQRRTKKGVQLAFSIYTTKRVAPACSANFIEKAMEKNLKALTEDHPIPDVIRLREEVRRTVKELHYYATHPESSFDTPTSLSHLRNKEIRNSKLHYSSKSRKIPSLAACYERSRGNGGALKELLSRNNLLDKVSLEEPITVRNFETNELEDDASRTVFDFSGHLRNWTFLFYAENPKKFCQPVEVYGVLDEEEQEELMHPSLDGYGIGVIVRREPIVEPFKVRVISKGEAVPYQRAQNIQPFLWRILQLTDCFALTGRPLESLDLERVLAFGRKSFVHCQIVSGDYKAATDNLHSWLCETALNEICHLWRIDYEDSLNMLACLTKHYLDERGQDDFRLNKLTGRLYDEQTPEQIKRDIGEEAYEQLRLDEINYSRQRCRDIDLCHKQLWGQLMGSPVSFPILCIINAAVTRYSLEQSFDREISLKDNAFLVNGDDVIFTIPSGQYQTWVRNVTNAGLSPSIGKNYVSRRYGVINSQLFDCGEDWDSYEKEIQVEHVPLLKMNLVQCGQHVTTERRKDASLFIGEALRHGKTLEGRMKELIQGWDHEFQQKLLKRAYRYAKEHLDLLPPVSWVLPKSLGGLGLPMTDDHSVSDHHLRIASLILCKDDSTRRDMVNLQWLREPGNVFCEETNRHLNDVYDSLGISTVLSTSKCDDALYGPVIKSRLGHGVDQTIIDVELSLRRWYEIYNRWSEAVKKTTWLDASIEPRKEVQISYDEISFSYSDDINYTFVDRVEIRHTTGCQKKGLFQVGFHKATEYEGFFWTREHSAIVR